MPAVDWLPPDLGDAEALIARRTKAAAVKELWRSVYTEAYQFAMPTRETFTWTAPGQNKNNRLYDSTLQEATYTAANTMVATLFPAWMRWAEFTPGGGIPKDDIPVVLAKGLQDATQVFFDYLDHSNFTTVINEAALDLQVGTSALQFDEGDNDNPFVFTSIPLSAIELEEGPNGMVETTWFPRKIKARDVVRSYEGLTEDELPDSLRDTIKQAPETDVEVLQGCIYHPSSKCYYGVAIHVSSKFIFWRWDFGKSSPMIVARANKVTGETYGRGRVLLALSDAKTLDKMVEFMLKHAAIQVAGAYTGVSDGVLNPYTAAIQPNIVIPVASNETSNPSLRPLDIGGNFQVGDVLVSDLRERIRRTMLGPEPTDGPVKSATEVMVNDRNRLWALGGESGRIQVELLGKIVARGVFILQKRGLIPKFKIDGREVTVRFTSPFAKSQSTEDLMALDRTLATLGALGPEMAVGTIGTGIKVDKLPEWVARKAGLDMSLVNDEGERQKIQKDAAGASLEAADVAMQAEAGK